MTKQRCDAQNDGERNDSKNSFTLPDISDSDSQVMDSIGD
jgi:hypothetical protein